MPSLDYNQPRASRLGVFIGAVAFLVAVAYVPWINGAATWPRWSIMAVALVGLVFCGPIRVTLAHIVGALFVALAGLSLSWSSAWHDGIAAMLMLLILAGVFMLGSKLPDLRPVYIGAALGIGVSSLLVLFDMSSLTGAKPAGGLFVNPLFLAEAAVLVALAFCTVPEMRERWIGLLTIPAIVGPVVAGTARGPLVALCCCGLVGLAQWRPRLAIGGAVLGVAGLVAAVWLRPSSVVDRLNIWAGSISGITPFGHGFGSFGSAFPEYGAGWIDYLARNDHAHNMAIELAFELGPIGVILAALFFWLLLWGRINTERMVLIAFLVMGIFAFPDRLPVTAGLAFLVAGHVARGLPRWRIALGLGGNGLFARHGCSRSANVD